MKRFLLFVTDQFYSYGGWNDFKGHFDTREEAEKKAKNILKTEKIIIK